ncbi:hypothetical protein M569_01521, partial [Genlisea aurea]
DGGVCSSETANGGEDVYSCNESDASSADHLVVMVHGIFGSPSDWKYAAEKFALRFPDKVFVHRSERNSAMLSLDGIDVMGERLAEEVLDVIKRKPNLTKISFIAHSLGGLMARYAIGKLYRNPNIANLTPINFITVATPHLGSQGNTHVPFLFGLTPLERALGNVVPWIFRKTGIHLFLKDGDGEKPPLLRRMVEDSGEYLFMSALGSFRRRVVYSNFDYDHIVGWRTASIRHRNKLPKWDDDTAIDEKYPNIIHEEHCEARDMTISDDGDGDDDDDDDDDLNRMDGELINGLSRVAWEKVDVSFQRCRFRFAAHNLIQVQDHFMHYEGKDVIRHLMDHFLV